MSMLSDFLSENALSPDDLRARSKVVESLGHADRALRVARQDARRTKKPYADPSLGKPTGLGRGVGEAVLKRALDGRPVPRLVRKKISRAVNSLLASQKKDPTDWRRLFGDVRARKGKSTKKK